MAQLSIPDATHERLKKHHKKAGDTMSKIAAHYIDEGIRRWESDKKTKKTKTEAG